MADKNNNASHPYLKWIIWTLIGFAALFVVIKTAGIL